MTEEKIREVEMLCHYLSALAKASETGVKTFSEVRRVIAKIEKLID